MVMVLRDGKLHVLQKSSQKKKKMGINEKNYFHDSMKYLLFSSQFFALFPLNGVLNSSNKNLHFSSCSFKIFYNLLYFCAATVESIWCIYFLTKNAEPFEIHRLNLSIFYMRGSLTCLAFLKLAKKWPSLVKEFDIVEKLLGSYPPTKIFHTKLRIITFGVFFAAAVEHFTVTIQNLVVSFKCEGTLAASVQHFFEMNYTHIFSDVPYHFFIGFFLQIINMITVFGWTFIDVFIVHVSKNFSEKLVQLNKKICLTVEKQVKSSVTWNELRENYTQLLQLFESLNDKLNDVILVSFASNIYFLLTQVFAWMRSSLNGEVALHHIYFIFSISLLISRTSFVCFYAASIQEETDNLSNTLAATPSNLYNEELERFIVQVNTCPMILSGRNYFYITRSLILKIAGSIVTYELVLIQFTEKIIEDRDEVIC